MIPPLKVYLQLLKCFGRQGWWPVARNGSAVAKHFPGRYKLKSDLEKFEVCIGAILTQNTSWRNVDKALARLREEKVLAPWDIARLKVNKLAGLIRSSGYYNQKAARLKDFAAYVVKHYQGSLTKMFEKPVDELRRELLALKGIGPETADSMILYSANKPVFVVDAYTLRFVKRLGWLKKPDYYSTQKFFVENLPRKLEFYNEYHALIVALGKDYCKKTPACKGCVLDRFCRKIK
jgi:endonuclease-3 related protein